MASGFDKQLRARATTRMSYFVLLRAALAKVSAIEEERLAPIGLTACEYAVLSLLGDLRPRVESTSRLATVLGIDRKAVRSAVLQLSSRKLINRIPLTDQRATGLALTSEGSAVLRKADQLHASAQRSVRCLMATADGSALRSALQRMLGI